MSDISTLKEKMNMKTFHFVLFTFVTAGLYQYIWLYKTSTAIEEVTGTVVLSKAFLIGYLTLLGIGGTVVNSPGFSSQEFALSWFLVIWILSSLWCFRVRRALRKYTLAKHDFEPRINRVFSVLLTFFHINYCINALPRDKQKHESKNKPDR